MAKVEVGAVGSGERLYAVFLVRCLEIHGNRGGGKRDWSETWLLVKRWNLWKNTQAVLSLTVTLPLSGVVHVWWFPTILSIQSG